MNHSLITFLTLLIFNLGLSYSSSAQDILPAACNPNAYLPLLKGKKIGLVVNQTSRVTTMHLVDTLILLDYQISRIFAPEHGFRGDEEAGAKVKSERDKKTGIPVFSLYGKQFKPDSASLADIDIMLFDIQDVGCRFYTYLSTMHYVMEACAKYNIPLMVLDRPNPNGFYIDGPVLEPEYKSFVGLHPIPIVHGMTLGELAKMINGEHWLGNGITCSLSVFPCLNYTHGKKYILPVPPSPNLRTMDAVYLYPTLCLFEGTDVSIGRGTSRPFELIGKPGFNPGKIKFTPKKIKGVAENPIHLNQECQGFDVVPFYHNFIQNSRRIYLLWLSGFYLNTSDTSHFFNSFFDKLAGTDQLRKQIINRTPVNDIYAGWSPGIKQFMRLREKYLIYPDF